MTNEEMTMNSNTRLERFQRSIWAAILLAAGFLLCQPDTALAQQVTGSGTLNNIPKWTVTGSILGDSVITESSGNVGIGSTNPQAKVHIYGTSGDIGLRLESGPGAIRLDFYSTTGGASDRNWTFRPDMFVWGDLVLFQSTSSGADPTGGTARF